MRNDTRTYVGEILDIYKQVGGRHGSIDSAESIVGLSGISLRCFLPVEKVSPPIPFTDDAQSHQ